MRLLLLLALLTVAVLGAIHHNFRVTIPLADAAVSAPLGDPPWLRSDSPSGAEDPHAGLYGGNEPHAGLYAGEDPHAGLYGGDDSYAASSVVVDGVCPRDGATGFDRVDDAIDRAEVDPHAMVRGHAAMLQAGLELRAVAPSTAPSGHTIADLHARRTALAERGIVVRGIVVKRTDGILAKSYVHLWDGSAAPETHADDLTIVTTEDFEIGETVEVEGRLLVDHDLGFGYRYPVLLDGARRVVEQAVATPSSGNRGSSAGGASR